MFFLAKVWRTGNRAQLGRFSDMMPCYGSQVRFDRIDLGCFDEIATPLLLFGLSPGDFLRKWSGGGADHDLWRGDRRRY